MEIDTTRIRIPAPIETQERGLLSAVAHEVQVSFLEELVGPFHKTLLVVRGIGESPFKLFCDWLAQGFYDVVVDCIP